MVCTVGMVLRAMQRTSKRPDKSRKNYKALGNYFNSSIYVVFTYAHCVNIGMGVDILKKEKEKELIEELICMEGTSKKQRNIGYFCKKYKISVDDVLAYYTQAYRIKQKRSKSND